MRHPTHSGGGGRMSSQLPLLELQVWQVGLLHTVRAPVSHRPVAALHVSGVQRSLSLFGHVVRAPVSHSPVAALHVSGVQRSLSLFGHTVRGPVSHIPDTTLHISGVHRSLSLFGQLGQSGICPVCPCVVGRPFPGQNASEAAPSPDASGLKPAITSTLVGVPSAGGPDAGSTDSTLTLKDSWQKLLLGIGILNGVPAVNTISFVLEIGVLPPGVLQPEGQLVLMVPSPSYSMTMPWSAQVRPSV